MSGPSRGEIPRRVRVTSPRRSARVRGPNRPLSTEIDEETALGEVYVDSLVRAQLRLSMSVLAGVSVVIGSLPILFLMVPAVHELRIGPIPLPWVVLGALIYPFAVIVARTYIRAAERVERDFTDFLRGR